MNISEEKIKLFLKHICFRLQPVYKKGDGSGYLEIKKGDDIISNDLDLAECFNDYFINVCVCVFFFFLPANLKEPIEQSTFDELKEHIKQKIPENVNFALSEIESFVFKYLSTHDVSKATGLEALVQNC